MSAVLRLLIADNAATRLGIRMAVGAEAEVIAETDDLELAIRAARREQPDMCLLGRRLAGERLHVLRAICRAAPTAAVVVFTHDPTADDLLECVRSGAVGYVPAAVDAGGLKRILRAIEYDEAVIPRSMVRELILELHGMATSGDGLTRREAQVLTMLRRGHSTGAIAERLDIVPVTVRRHIAQVVHKLGVENRSALIGPAPLRRGAVGAGERHNGQR